MTLHEYIVEDDIVLATCEYILDTDIVTLTSGFFFATDTDIRLDIPGAYCAK